MKSLITVISRLSGGFVACYLLKQSCRAVMVSRLCVLVQMSLKAF